MSSHNVAEFTAPGMKKATSEKVVSILQDRLVSLIDLQLTLKHVHWNVVGPNFIGVHEMLDPQVDSVRSMTDTIAERIATLGGVPVGTPSHVAARSAGEDYPLGRGSVPEHLVALDTAYSTVNMQHREALGEIAKLDPVAEDMLFGQLSELEQYQWFVRAHLSSADGTLPVSSTRSDAAAVRSAN